MCVLFCRPSNYESEDGNGSGTDQRKSKRFDPMKYSRKSSINEHFTSNFEIGIKSCFGASLKQLSMDTLEC